MTWHSMGVLSPHVRFAGKLEFTRGKNKQSEYLLSVVTSMLQDFGSSESKKSPDVVLPDRAAKIFELYSVDPTLADRD